MLKIMFTSWLSGMHKVHSEALGLIVLIASS